MLPKVLNHCCVNRPGDTSISTHFYKIESQMPASPSCVTLLVDLRLCCIVLEVHSGFCLIELLIRCPEWYFLGLSMCLLIVARHFIRN